MSDAWMIGVYPEMKDSLFRTRQQYFQARLEEASKHYAKVFPEMLTATSGYFHGEARTRIGMSQVASLRIPVLSMSVQKRCTQIADYFDRVRAMQERPTRAIGELLSLSDAESLQRGTNG